MMKKKLYIFIVIILSFLIFATYKIFVENKTIVEKDTILAMDTQISWVIYEKPSLYPLDLNAKIKTRIDELVKLLSVTDENSEIYKVNHHQERDIKLSEDTKNVVLFALQMAEKTNGALEPTIYPVLREWGFTTGKYQIPDETKIRDLLNYVDYRKVSLKENQIYLPDGMQIDLGAVAKGYIGDALSTALFVMGVDEAINYWKQNKDENDAFEMILITDDKKIYITENLVDSFTLQDKYKDYHMVVITL